MYDKAASACELQHQVDLERCSANPGIDSYKAVERPASNSTTATTTTTTWMPPSPLDGFAEQDTVSSLTTDSDSASSLVVAAWTTAAVALILAGMVLSGSWRRFNLFMVQRRAIERGDDIKVTIGDAKRWLHGFSRGAHYQQQHHHQQGPVTPTPAAAEETIMEAPQSPVPDPIDLGWDFPDDQEAPNPEPIMASPGGALLRGTFLGPDSLPTTLLTPSMQQLMRDSALLVARESEILSPSGMSVNLFRSMEDDLSGYDLSGYNSGFNTPMTVSTPLDRRYGGMMPGAGDIDFDMYARQSDGHPSNFGAEIDFPVPEDEEVEEPSGGRSTHLMGTDAQRMAAPLLAGTGGMFQEGSSRMLGDAAFQVDPLTLSFASSPTRSDPISPQSSWMGQSSATPAKGEMLGIPEEEQLRTLAPSTPAPLINADESDFPSGLLNSRHIDINVDAFQVDYDPVDGAWNPSVHETLLDQTGQSAVMSPMGEALVMQGLGVQPSPRHEPALIQFRSSVDPANMDADAGSLVGNPYDVGYASAPNFDATFDMVGQSPRLDAVPRYQ